MNEQLSTFETLVRTLESSQRKEMLRQLAETSELLSESLQTSQQQSSTTQTDEMVSDKKLLDEPFYIRLWFFIFAIFNSTSPSRLYAEHQVIRLGKKLSAFSGQYINPKQRFFTNEFNQELHKLKQTQSFFSSLLTAYENDKGGFHIILASMVMKETCDAIVAATDPFSIPYDQEQKKDIRLSFLREMDTIFASIPESDRNQMYQSVQAIEWVKNFCSIPFDQLMHRFNSIVGSQATCAIDSAEGEIKELANLLHSAKRVPFLLLEALFLFAVQDKIQQDGFDLEKECSVFVNAASSHLTNIGHFKSAIPIVDFVRFTIGDIAWTPSIIDGGEDWFVLFKNAWKKRFDEKWSVWNRLYRKSMIERSIFIFLEKDELPALAYHPWEGLWLPLLLQHELSLSFLKALFTSVYPQRMMKPLKILLLDGDFYRRENLMEYTDAFNTLEHQQQQMELFEKRLSPKGDIGEGFMLASKENIASVRGKARLENLMLSVEFESATIVNNVKSAFRSIDAVLGGILAVVRGGPYETLINMAAIQGNQNEKYRKELDSVRQLIRIANEILCDVEIIEKETV